MTPEQLTALAEQATELPRSAYLPLDPLVDLHIDGDYAAYYYSGNDETPFGTARRKLLDAIAVARQVAGAGGACVLHLTGGMSDKAGRFKIATVKPYQGHRDGKSKPKNWETMREFMEQSKTLGDTDIRVVIWQDREADDGVSAAARYAWQSGRIPALFSRDKDFRMIPGRHIVWMTLERLDTTPDTYIKLDEDGLVYGLKWFWQQMLQGDATDGIPGLEGQPAAAAGKFKPCGEKCAEQYLAPARDNAEAFRVVRSMYQTYYGEGWAPRFAEQAALLWLRTDNRADVGDFLGAVPAKDDALIKAVHALRRRIA